MPIPNASIRCSSRLMEEGSAWGRLPHRSLQTGALAGPPNLEPGCTVAPPPPISTNDDSAREHTGSPIRAVDEAKGSRYHLPNERR